jgi:putative membrane protein
MRTATASCRQTKSFRRRLFTSFLALSAACALALSATSAWPQAAGQSGATVGPAARTAPGATTSQPEAANRNPSALAAEDLEMMEDLAHANLGEIEMGRTALEKTRNERVRQLAQTMIDDRSAAMNELRQLAQRKRVQLPDDTDFQHKAIGVALRVLTGDTFDQRFVRHVGVNNQRRTVDLLEKMQRTARDPDLKAHAEKQLPIVQRHLTVAREMSTADASAMGARGEPPKN